MCRLPHTALLWDESLCFRRELPQQLCDFRKCRWPPSSQSGQALGLLNYIANACDSLFLIARRSFQVLLISSFSSSH